MSPLKLSICMALVGLISACSVAPAADVSADAGWHLAHVERVIDAHEQPSVLGLTQDCRSALTQDGQQHVWLLVEIRHPRFNDFRIVQADPHHQYTYDEPVYVNTNDCQAQSRIVTAASKTGVL